MTSFVTSSRRVSFDDFELGEYMQEGGWGKVYSATRKSDGRKVAMKFFGYTKARPDVSEINREIGLMIKLDRVQGVCQLVGIFQDTAEGILENKNPMYLEAYPVLVLEMLDGGDLFNRISKRSTVTEQYLAISFMSAMKALQSIHDRGFVHRDLKLDNIMCLRKTDPTEVKIIDFGMMKGIPYPQESFQDEKVMGTDGYFAPETLLHREYGYKSDVWQMGCILYSMLAGHPPFHSEAKYRKFLVLGKFYPMTGPSWENISVDAKDLVARMLSVNPRDRISAGDILSHAWLMKAATAAGPSEQDTSHIMGEQYSLRIKRLVLRSKFKRCFVDDCLQIAHLERKRSFQSELPFLDTENVTANPHDFGISNVADYVRLSEEYNSKLRKIKDLLLTGEVEVLQDEDSEQAAKRRKKIFKLEVDFDKYCSVMKTVGLENLATRGVFNIFDVDGDRSINMKEFLLALIALRSRHSTEEEEEAAGLYFSIFDVNEDGYICPEEMEMVLNCLLHDGAGPLFNDAVNDRNIDEVFREIDTDGNGLIDFNEFKKFYDSILQSSTVSVDTA